MVSLMNKGGGGGERDPNTTDIEIEIALWNASSKIILFYKKTLHILFLHM